MTAPSSGASVLYTGDVLALAASLAEYPITDDLLLRGQARSAACGSSLTLGLALDARGHITRAGVSASACAIGQAAAAIFLAGARGRGADDIAAGEREIAAWLAAAINAQSAALPSWPGLAAIAAAAGFPGRHGAILLAWRAAGMAFSVAGLPSDAATG